MIKKYTELLEEFRKIKSNGKHQKTFMEVSGYPHYENVVSNILAFLFDDGEEHGLKNLWINALLACINENQGTSNVSVEREVCTDSNKRIDLIITTDDFLICIENKIFAELYNDLKNYKETVAKRNLKYSKKQINIVLSLKPCSNDCDFTNITYPQLFSSVNEKLGAYIGDCNNTWLLYIKDFMITIESLLEDKNVNKEFEEFYKKYYADIKRLDEEKNKYLDSIISEISALKEIVQNKLTDTMKEYKNGSVRCDEVKTYYSRSEMRRSVYIDFDLDSSDEKAVAVETSRDCWGWHISLLKRKGKTDIAKEIIDSIGEHELKHLSYGYPNHHIIKDLPSDISIEEIASEIFSVINKYILNN